MEAAGILQNYKTHQYPFTNLDVLGWLLSFPIYCRLKMAAVEGVQKLAIRTRVCTGVVLQKRRGEMNHFLC